MRKTLLLLLGMLFMWAGQVNAQWSVDAVETDYTIDFETTVSGVNEGGFDGSGFATTPATGQLDADAWAIYGMSDGDKDFGVENTTGDLARGASTGGETSGGVYSFEVETGNNALGAQGAGSDFTPGWIGLKLQNNTGETVNNIAFSYDVWVYNDQDRSQTFNGEFSLDGTNWTAIPELAFATVEIGDAAPVWEKTTLSYTGEMGVDVNDGDFLYFRWYSDDNGGGGSRDEIAVDNITANLSYESGGPCGIGQSELFLTTSGGSYPSEKWVNITTEVNGAGTVVWAQGDGNYGNGAGLLTNESVCVDNGTTFYINAYDAYADGWDGTIYELEDQYGIIVANNGGISPSDGTDTDAASTWEDPALELESSEAFSYTPVSCPPPSDLALDANTADQATFSWTENGSATDWNLIYGAPGFDPLTEGTTVAADANPYTITGLSPDTEYDVYVQTNCGAGDLSTLDGPINFTTDVWIELDLTGDDITITWNAPVGTFDPGIIINGAPYNTDGGFFLVQLYDESDNLVTFADVFEEFAIAGTNYSSGPSNRLLADFTATQQSGIWGTAAVSDNAAAGGSLRGTTLDGSLFYGVMVDGTVGTVGAVLPGTGDETATMAYTIADDVYGTYTLEANYYVPFRPGAVGSAGYYTVAELEGLESLGSISREIDLGCAPVTSFPFVEDFETTSTTLNCWSVLNNNGDTDEWTIQTSPTYANSGDQSYKLYTDYNGGANDDYLISPQITLTGNEQLRFATRVHGSTEPNDFEVLLSTTGTAPADFTETILPLAVYSNNTYDEITIDLSSYTGNVYVAFHVPSGGEDGWNLYIDDVIFEEIPSCTAPTSLALDANTATEATFSWTENGTAMDWNLIYGAPGFDPLTEGTTVAADANPFTIDALMANTEYDVYVQSDCGAGDLSPMNGPVNFTTDCGVYTTPFSEDFTSYIPDCWSEATGLLADPVTILSTSSAWGADGFANVGTTGAARVNNYGTTRDEWLITPEIDLGDGSVTMQLEFDLALTAYAGTGAATAAPDDKFAVIVSTDGGATWTSANTLAIWDNEGSPYVYDNIATAGERIILDLTGYTGAVKFGFYAESTVSNGDNDLFIDNVDVLETPDCAAPTALALDAVTIDEATFSWTENGTAIAWNLVFGAPGFDPLTEGTTVPADAIPFTIDGLTDATTYEIYVQADCGSGSTSTFSSPITFTTECDVIVAPYTQDFENGGDAPICWTNEGVDEQWEFGTTAAYGPSADHTSGTGYFAWVDDSTPHSTDVVLTSPVIDITSLTNPTLYFWLYSDNNGASNMTLNVDVWDGTTWNNAVASYAANTTGWTEMLVDLSAYAGSGNVQVRFHADETSSGTDYENDIAIDDVSFDEAPSCFTPSNIAVDAFTATTATLSWTENGTETNWNIVYGTPGFDPLTEGTTVAADANPFTVDPLTADTEYEFYVQADCGGGDLSNFTGPVYVFTGYCQPAPSSVDNSGITNVTFGETSVVDNATGTETNNYGDYSTMVGDGAQGTDITVSITFETGYTYGTKIWVDWNNDLVFNDAEELVYTGLSASDNPTTLDATFNIPFATPLGNYRMRIGGTDNDAGPSSPCYTGFYGSFEDYTLEVTPAPACPVITGLTTAGIGSDFAIIDWDALGTSEWNIKVSDGPIDPETQAGNVEEVFATTTKPYTISATLTPNTTYYFYVQATCGADWSNEAMFTTPCEAITAFPFTEDFDGDWSTWCWTIVDNDNDGTTWEQDDAYITPHSGDWTAHGMGNADDYLITPGLSINSASFIVEWWDVVESATYNNTYDVLVSTTDANIASFTDNLGTFDCTNTDWINHQLDLSAYDGQTIYIAFHQTYSGSGWYGFGIDDFAVREVSTETDFLTYSFPEQTGAANIDYTAYTIDVEVGNGTDLTTLVADYTLSTGASADIAGTPQESGVTANDFSSPVTYTVTAEDGTTTQAWVVTVTEAAINTETDIVSYTFPEATSAATIDATEKTVDIEVAWNADVTALVADFTLSYGATAAIAGTDQESGVTENDFTDPVVYTVTAEDGTTTDDWTVTVTMGDTPLGANCDNPYLVNLPSELPYTHADQTNCGLANVYDETELEGYDNGEDAIYEITVTSDVFVNITLDPGTTTWSGIGLFDGCPGTDNLITSVTNSNSNPRVIEGVALTAGTYYIMIDTWPSPDCIDNYTLTITTDPIADYANNTTLTLTPETQNVATGDNANGVLDVVYPTTVSDDMPVDMMTDAMIDLSELTGGSVVELFDDGTSLGTYTVTGGETVWASEAFTGVNRVAADMTEGQSLSWDVVISGLADGTYNVSATLYLGLDADLTAQTNMTEAATDAMEIIVAAPFIDLALLMPDGNAFVCDFTDPQNVPVEIENVGNTTIATGETINFILDVNGSNEITEDIILSEDLLPGETYETMTTNTIDFSALGLYEWEATIVYTGDVDMMNNFTSGYTVHFEQEIEFVDAVNDTITIASTDWPYTIETNLTLSTDSVLVSTYEWELDGSTETSLTVNADGWYTLHVTTEYCTTTDSVYVLAFNNIEGVTADEFSVYPNPNNGQFMIEMNLVEKQDVLLSIFNSNGQLVREFKFDDIDSFARQIDMNNVAEGLYLIRINAGGKMFNSQVVIR
jgi:hypothetical protein